MGTMAKTSFEEHIAVLDQWASPDLDYDEIGKMLVASLIRKALPELQEAGTRRSGTHHVTLSLRLRAETPEGGVRPLACCVCDEEGGGDGGTIIICRGPCCKIVMQ
jgi:hypothetical protein